MEIWRFGDLEIWRFGDLPQICKSVGRDAPLPPTSTAQGFLVSATLGRWRRLPKKYGLLFRGCYVKVVAPGHA